MSFPAERDFEDDATFDRQRTACRIYRKLRRNQNIFFEPQSVKAWALAEELKTSRERVQKGLVLLIQAGYVVEVERDRGTHVRKLMLVRERGISCTRSGTASAA